MEKISIIIPVYNVKKYLNDCIQSVINQTYNNLEIILIDDGSTDGSEYCDEIAKDSRIFVYHKTNGGLSEARNVGIKISTGKYITFIDSDDYIENLYIEALYNS
ncbi:MAG: glycosyltransferase family 2 protein [Streptococcus agalactiae]